MIARWVCITDIQSVVVGAGGWWLWWLLSILQGHGSYSIFRSLSLLSKAAFVAQNMDVTVPYASLTIYNKESLPAVSVTGYVWHSRQ
jgi:hypothetical protein